MGEGGPTRIGLTGWPKRSNRTGSGPSNLLLFFQSVTNRTAGPMAHPGGPAVICASTLRIALMHRTSSGQLPITKFPSSFRMEDR